MKRFLDDSHPFGVDLTAAGKKVRFITVNVIEGVIHSCSNAKTFAWVLPVVVDVSRLDTFF